MFVFIDESGIHKQDGQSTTALVYVAVENLERLNRAILGAEQKLKIETFHWSKEIWKIRLEFLEVLLKEVFEVKIFVFKNPFSEAKLEYALKYLLTEKFFSNIIIDGRKPKTYLLRLKTALRHSGVSVKKIRMGNDESFPCLRLADLFAGITRVYFNNPNQEQAKYLYKKAKIKIATLSGGQVSQISRP